MCEEKRFFLKPLRDSTGLNDSDEIAGSIVSRKALAAGVLQATTRG